MADEDKGILASAWDFITGDDDDERSPREREMVAAAIRPPPVINRNDYETRLDYSLAKTAAKNDYRRYLEDREMNPDKYLVPAAYAEADPTSEERGAWRKQALEEAEREIEGQ